MIPGDLLSACPHRQFHTLPSLLDSRAALPNSYPNALRAMQGGSLYHFNQGLWYNPESDSKGKMKIYICNSVIFTIIFSNHRIYINSDKYSISYPQQFINHTRCCQGKSKIIPSIHLIKKAQAIFKSSN